MVLIPLSVIKWIAMRFEFVMMFIGAFSLLLFGFTSLDKTETVPIPISTTAQLEENEAKTVILRSSIEDSGYYLETTTTGIKTIFYIAELEDGLVLLSCDMLAQSKMNKIEAGDLDIVGYVKKISSYEDYRKLQEAICEDLGIEFNPYHDSQFNDIFSPYIIDVRKIGEEGFLQTEKEAEISPLNYANLILHVYLYPLGLLVGGIIIHLVKRKKGFYNK